MKITVTAEDITNGQAGDAKCCPVALALRRAGYRLPMVSWDGINVVGKYYTGQLMSYNADHPVARFVRDYDMDNKVVPFEFECPDMPQD